MTRLPDAEALYPLYVVMQVPNARARVRMLRRVQEILLTEWLMMPPAPERDERLELLDAVKELRVLVEAALEVAR